MLDFSPDPGGWLRHVPLLAQGQLESVTDAAGQSTSMTSIVFVIALVCAAYWLIQTGIVHGRIWLVSGIGVGLVALVAAGWLMPANFASYITYAFFALAVAGAIGFLSSREPVYAALGFTTTVLSICGILFMQSALFVAAATMIVYAGATIIIFLFVLMFAQQTELQAYDVRLNRPTLAMLLGAVLMAAIAVSVTQPGLIPQRRVDTTRLLSEAGMAVVDVQTGNDPTDILIAESADAATPAAVEPIYPVATAELGRSLYTDYLATVELAGVLLLVAAVGAIALATRTTPEVN